MEPRQKQKLLYIITKSNYGGAQRYVHELATHFSKDYEVVVACGGRGLMVEKLKEAGVRTVQIKNFQRDISVLKEVRAIRELWQLYKNERPDVVHLNSSKAGLLGAAVGRAARVPRIIFTIHGWAHLEPRSWWWRFLTWCGGYLTVLFTHQSIPISEYDVKYSYLFGLKHKLSSIIYNGVAPDPDLLTQSDARRALLDETTITEHKNDKWLITTAELHPKKNIATVIEAVVSYNHLPDTKQKIFYCVMGDGVLYEELQSLILHYQASDQIKLLGYITDAKKYLQAGDIFLLPSKQEGLPFALLEAGSAGLPTIASNVCGIPEVITHEQNGLLFDPYSVDSLVQAIRIMAREPLTRATYAMTFNERITEVFSREEMLSKVAGIYKTAIT